MATGPRARQDGDRHAAQQRTVRELASFAGIAPGSSVLDAGCGVGGPALYLAGELACMVDGITLSSKQVELANEKAAAAGVADRASFRVLDALRTDLADGSVDNGVGAGEPGADG